MQCFFNPTLISSLKVASSPTTTDPLQLYMNRVSCHASHSTTTVFDIFWEFW